MLCTHRGKRLTDDVHAGKIEPHAVKDGVTGRGVIVPAGAVLPPTAVIRTLKRVLEPANMIQEE